MYINVKLLHANRQVGMHKCGQLIYQWCACKVYVLTTYNYIIKLKTKQYIDVTIDVTI